MAPEGSEASLDADVEGSSNDEITEDASRTTFSFKAKVLVGGKMRWYDNYNHSDTAQHPVLLASHTT